MEDLDFIEKHKERTFYDVGITERGNMPIDKDTNIKFDMRINTLTHDKYNNATIKLVFRLDYFPDDIPDLYTLYCSMDIIVFDKNRVLEKDITGDLSIAYLSWHYKENGERLFEKLQELSKKLFKRGLTGNTVITDLQAQEQVAIITKKYSNRNI